MFATHTFKLKLKSSYIHVLSFESVFSLMYHIAWIFHLPLLPFHHFFLFYISFLSLLLLFKAQCSSRGTVFQWKTDCWNICYPTKVSFLLPLVMFNCTMIRRAPGAIQLGPQTLQGLQFPCSRLLRSITSPIPALKSTISAVNEYSLGSALRRLWLKARR